MKSLISAVRMKLPLLVKNYRVPHLNIISLVLDNPVTNSIIALYPLMHTVHYVDVGFGFTNTRGLTSHYISIKDAGNKESLFKNAHSVPTLHFMSSKF